MGTIINVAAVLAGTTVGILLKGGLPKRLEKGIMAGIGLAVLMIGMTGALSAMLTVEDGVIATRDVLLLVVSLVAGALVGEGIDIEDKLERLGLWVKGKFSGGSGADSRFVEGFVTASLLFCVGAMAIVGSIEDGLQHNYSTLAAKSVMDGVAAIILAASFGGGVYLSAAAVAVYQGAITLLAGWLSVYLTDALIQNISMVGSVLILGLSFNMILDRKVVRVGNLLPAVVIPVLYHLVRNLVQFFL